MVARWASFASGLWLLFAPLVLGYDAAPAVLHDVAVGLVVCTVALAALEWPLVRFLQVVPAAWLAVAPRALGWDSDTVIANELATAVVVAALAAFPSAKLRRAPSRGSIPGAAEASRAA